LKHAFSSPLSVALGSVTVAAGLLIAASTAMAGSHSSVPATAEMRTMTQSAAPAPKSTQGNSEGAAVIYQPSRSKFSKDLPFAKLQVTVIDGRTRQPLSGAEVVIAETEGRYRTGADGNTPAFDAPVIRNPRFQTTISELHGQLTAIVYKDSYHDSIHFGIRMHPGTESHTTVWMYKLIPGDRIEPVEYHVPIHRLWLIQLADRYRSPSQPGEGPERPD